MKTPISILILVSFLITAVIGPLPVYAQGEFRLPAPGVMVHLSPPLDPPMLKGIKVHPDNPFRFDFILDKGDGRLKNDQLKEESKTLIKYFLASLTIPEKDLWVNLSPYEKDRIIPQSFGLTEMGRDLLAEDYMLKQITASLIYPEDEIGKKFWKRIYEEAQKKFGTTNIPVNTFNKVWIVPEKAVVYENAEAGTAYVVESRLKVMLEQDYLALSKNVSMRGSETATVISKRTTRNDVNALGSQIVREIVIPELSKEVNEDKNFSQLRQVYNSLILATWYKKKIKDSILSQVYSDKNKVAGVNIDDPQEKEKIYQQYLKAFKKGVYNYIKEEVDPLTQETIPKKYFSGGFGFAGYISSNLAMISSLPKNFLSTIRSNALLVLTAGILMAGQASGLSSQTNELQPGQAAKAVQEVRIDLDSILKEYNNAVDASDIDKIQTIIDKGKSLNDADRITFYLRVSRINVSSFRHQVFRSIFETVHGHRDLLTPAVKASLDDNLTNLTPLGDDTSLRLIERILNDGQPSKVLEGPHSDYTSLLNEFNNALDDNNDKGLKTALDKGNSLSDPSDRISFFLEVSKISHIGMVEQALNSIFDITHTNRVLLTPQVIAGLKERSEILRSYNIMSCVRLIEKILEDGQQIEEQGVLLQEITQTQNDITNASPENLTGSFIDEKLLSIEGSWFKWKLAGYDPRLYTQKVSAIVDELNNSLMPKGYFVERWSGFDFTKHDRLYILFHIDQTVKVTDGQGIFPVHILTGVSPLLNGGTIDLDAYTPSHFRFGLVNTSAEIIDDHNEIQEALSNPEKFDRIESPKAKELYLKLLQKAYAGKDEKTRVAISTYMAVRHEAEHWSHNTYLHTHGGNFYYPADETLDLLQNLSIKSDGKLNGAEIWGELARMVLNAGARPIEDALEALTETRSYGDMITTLNTWFDSKTAADFQVAAGQAAEKYGNGIWKKESILPDSVTVPTNNIMYFPSFSEIQVWNQAMKAVTDIKSTIEISNRLRELQGFVSKKPYRMSFARNPEQWLADYDIYQVVVQLVSGQGEAGFVKFAIPKKVRGVLRVEFLEAYFPGHEGDGLYPQIFKTIAAALPENVVIGQRKIQNWPTLVGLARMAVQQLELPGLEDLRRGYLARDNILGMKIIIHQYDLAKARKDYSKVGPVEKVSEFLKAYIQTQQERQSENEHRREQRLELLTPLDPLGIFYGDTVLGRALENAGFHYHEVLYSQDREIGLHALSRRINPEETVNGPEDRSMKTIEDYRIAVQRVQETPNFRRLSDVLGFTGMGADVERRYIKDLSVDRHDIRTSQVASKVATRLGLNAPKAEFIGLVHDYGALPFRHITMQGQLKQILAQSGFDSKKHLVGLLQQDGFNLPNDLIGDLLNFDIAKIGQMSSEGAIAVASESVEGVVEDILFALKYKMISFSEIPQTLKEALTLDSWTEEELLRTMDSNFDSVVIQLAEGVLMKGEINLKSVVERARIIKQQAREQLIVGRIFNNKIIDAKAEIAKVDPLIMAAFNTNLRNSGIPGNEGVLNALDALSRLSEIDLLGMVGENRPSDKAMNTGEHTMMADLAKKIQDFTFETDPKQNIIDVEHALNKVALSFQIESALIDEEREQRAIKDGRFNNRDILVSKPGQTEKDGLPKLVRDNLRKRLSDPLFMWVNPKNTIEDQYYLIKKLKEELGYLQNVINSPESLEKKGKLIHELAALREVVLTIKDMAMRTKVTPEGGINLTPANMNLQTNANGGAIKFHLDPAMLQQLQNATGFVPVIINLEPLGDLRMFLGFKKGEGIQS